MNNLLLEKLEELFNELDKCPEIKEMLDLKNNIYKDPNLASLLKKFHSIDEYSLDAINIKKKIINNDLITRYRKLENNLYFILLEINSKLNKLIDKKGCNNENN